MHPVCCILNSGNYAWHKNPPFPGFSMTEESKEDSSDNKDTEEEEEKQVEEVTVSNTNRGKIPTIEEKKGEHEVIASEPKYRKTPTREDFKLEKVKHEVAVGEGEATETTHIKETNSDPKSNILATDEERTDGTSTARITNQGRESLFHRSQFYDA